MSSFARLLLLACLAGTATAGPQLRPKHPRNADRPLDVEMRPWFCPTCLAQGRIEGDEREIEVFERSAYKLADRLGIRDGKWFVIETPHFVIFSSLRRARIHQRSSRFLSSDLDQVRKVFPELKGTSLNAHQRAHLYHARCERIYAHFRALTGNKEPWLGMEARYEVVLFDKVDDYRECVRDLGLATNTETLYRHYFRKDRHWGTVTAQRFYKGDLQLNSTVLHQLGHLLVNGHRGYFTDAPAWLEEGFAHYYDRRESWRHNHFCKTVMEPPKGLERGDWRLRIRKLVERKKDRPFGSWCEKLQPNELSDVEHALAWSFVEWLMKTDPVRLAKLLDKSADHKNKPTPTQAVQAVYGVTPAVMHERWRAYVLANYR